MGRKKEGAYASCGYIQRDLTRALGGARAYGFKDWQVPDTIPPLFLARSLERVGKKIRRLRLSWIALVEGVDLVWSAFEVGPGLPWRSGVPFVPVSYICCLILNA